MKFIEDSRVKIPALLHLARLGYTYIPRSKQFRLEENNIFSDIFKESISRINPDLSSKEMDTLLEDLCFKLTDDDLGRGFFKQLINTSGVKLVDFDNFDNNSFHVTTELTCKNGEEEFRPDITVLVNGMPLVFIEVKKPNNKQGVIDERNRINRRFTNPAFKTFSNITQLMIFSNNMEYEDGVIDPVYGAFYATSANGNLHFNYFREEENLNLTHLLKPESTELEDFILKDNNIVAIKNTDEFLTNKDYNKPTNRILTSLLSKDRLAFILQFGLAYLEEEIDGVNVIQKHIMRYPQIFATKAIKTSLENGVKKGIIWHTQGSGKTALAYYNVKFLTDFYQKKNIIPKFYFVVDRLDLANQAASEFGMRGLIVKRVNSRSEFLNDIKTISAIQNSTGEPEISVINIQKFTEESTVEKELDYDLNIQRIYFIDEAHRSYNPKGNYLLNLLKSDENAIKIALTGTPLLKEVAKDYDSKAIFGDYIHKYYYNKSIADGYTLRLIREGINTQYKLQMQDIMDEILKKGTISKSDIFAHPKFAEPMLDYILKDLKAFRKTHQDDSLGAMVVCDSSDQAKALFTEFEKIYGKQTQDYLNVAEEKAKYGNNDSLKASLILHDINDKEYRKKDVKSFKAGDIDILFVYNMLLTGFDAKRLKKLYLARVVKHQNLLQTLTRVNRPYKNYKFGYVVDFADISKEFKITNDNYFQELQNELGDEMQNYSNLFKTREEIQEDKARIKEFLFQFDISNAENFSDQIIQISDKKRLQDIINVLSTAKELRNIIRLQGDDDLLNGIDFFKLNQLLKVVQERLASINFVENLDNEDENNNLLNAALEDIYFQFVKVSEEEMIIADQLRNDLRKTREELQRNIDQKDPEFITLREELERIFKKKNLDEVSQEDMRNNIQLLNSVYAQVRDLNNRNSNLNSKYDHDEKFTRIHKRLMEKGSIFAQESQIHEALMDTKTMVDLLVLNNANILKEGNDYFNDEVLSIIIQKFIDNKKMKLDFETTQNINHLVVNEYRQQSYIN
ncbi:type I restriction endonuclease subunit R [Epilithonimonas tenax]|uniref:type I restriction endonuclease subunit R n=1 Tax=Epilithonimonas tenax TaxID=191577 RepID=UPI0004892E39|nr:type I restriction endonuclease [Epilithonimonas tenax]